MFVGWLASVPVFTDHFNALQLPSAAVSRFNTDRSLQCYIVHVEFHIQLPVCNIAYVCTNVNQPRNTFLGSSVRFPAVC